MSEEKEIKEQEMTTNESPNTEDSIDETPVEEIPEEETPQEPTWEERYAELNNKYLRIHAEFDNYRKRTNKEKVDIIGSANAGVLKDLIPVIDDFERAMVNNEKAEDLKSVKEGFTLIFNKFKGLLEQKGLIAMDAQGKEFDSEIHEAIANVPAPSKKLRGKVIEAVEKGYYLNDKVIRYAKVVVGQ